MTLEISFNYHASIRSFLLLRIKRIGATNAIPSPVIAKLKHLVAFSLFPSLSLSLSLLSRIASSSLPFGRYCLQVSPLLFGRRPRSPRIPFARKGHPYIRQRFLNVEKVEKVLAGDRENGELLDNLDKTNHEGEKAGNVSSGVVKDLTKL